MKFDEPVRSILLGCLFTAALFPTAYADQTPTREPALDPAPALPPGGSQRGLGALIVEYLNQDIFLRPGVGLKQIHIGMRFDQVRAIWGPPTHTDRHGLLDNKWSYKVGPRSRIVLIGEQHVQFMHVAGGIGSPYLTTEGASFGMPTYQVTRIYGRRKLDSSGDLTYPRRGIGFNFDHGRLSEIRVFRPH